jgi:integrase
MLLNNALDVFCSVFNMIYSNVYATPLHSCSIARGMFMASLTRINGKYHVRVRIKGHKTHCNSFIYKADALKWALETDRAIRLGEFQDEDKKEDITIGELLQRYSQQISISKKSCTIERLRIGKMQRHWISQIMLSKLCEVDIARYRDERLVEVSSVTCLRDLGLISHMINIARREWGYKKPNNPVSGIRKPTGTNQRNRRLEDGEESRLLASLSLSENRWLHPLVRFAIETAMRRGELLSLKRFNVNVSKRYVHLPDTKNGESRNVPLSPTALSILNDIPVDDTNELVFPVHYEGLKGLWKRALKRADITDLRFHDLRHEATSRFFEKGLNVMEVAAITGHKDLRMLKRYTHLRAEDLALKLI